MLSAGADEDEGEMAFVEQIYVVSRGGQPMQPVAEVEAVEGRGLAGDRYFMRTGYWTDDDECQVTLIEAEGLDEIRSSSSVQVSAGQHRRNIVTRGIDLQGLAGKTFSIGDAVLEYDRPRPPCRYIQSVSEAGMTKALGRDRGGICARVVTSGTIHVNDRIEVFAARAARD
jgi:MOSC domain-containing protein YiiM